MGAGAEGDHPSAVTVGASASRRAARPSPCVRPALLVGHTHGQAGAPFDLKAMADGAVVTGRVVARRVLGKQLAFATLAVERPAGHVSSGSPAGEELKLCFHVSTWDPCSEAPFPARRSLLQVGSRVTVETQPEPGAEAVGVLDREAATVVRWTVHEQGGGRAAGRISTVGLATTVPTAHDAPQDCAARVDMPMSLRTLSRCRMPWQRLHRL